MVNIPTSSQLSESFTPIRSYFRSSGRDYRHNSTGSIHFARNYSDLLRLFFRLGK